VVVQLDDEHCCRLKNSDFGHHVAMVSHLVVVGVLDESLALEVTKGIKVVLTVMEDACVALQSLHGDGAAAGGLHGDLKGTRAMRFIGAISAVGNTVAQAHLLDARGVGAAEVDIVVEVGRARGARAQIWDLSVAVLLVRTVGAIRVSVAAAGL
jgi:hypothetical protein